MIGSGITASRLAPTDVGIQLLENAAATAGALIWVILMFGACPVPTTTRWCPMQRHLRLHPRSRTRARQLHPRRHRRQAAPGSRRRTGADRLHAHRRRSHRPHQQLGEAHAVQIGQPRLQADDETSSVTVSFVPDPAIVAQVAALAAAEQVCCAFIHFDIAIARKGIDLTATTSRDAEPIVHALLGVPA